MLVRSDSKEPLLAGKVGIFFGPWWSGYTVADATLAGAADWQAYLHHCLRMETITLIWQSLQHNM